jgi:hypothetical protein
MTLTEILLFILILEGFGGFALKVFQLWKEGKIFKQS